MEIKQNLKNDLKKGKDKGDNEHDRKIQNSEMLDLNLTIWKITLNINKWSKH